MTRALVNTLPLGQPAQNFIINGNFDFWQRGTSFSTGGAGYGADRMAHFISSTTISQQPSDLAGSTYCHRVALSNSAAYSYLYQPLEQVNVKLLQTKQVTASFYIRCNANFSGLISFALQKNATPNTQLGGTWSTLQGYGANIIPTATWTRYTLTTTVPADGTAEGLRIAVWNTGTSASSGYYEIGQVMLNIGPAVAPFALAGGDIQSELAKCQRYYEYGYNGINGLSTLGQQKFLRAAYKVTKRIASPTIYTWDSGGVTGGTGAAARITTLNSSGTSTLNVTPALIQSYIDGTHVFSSAAGTETGMTYYWAADAELP